MHLRGAKQNRKDSEFMPRRARKNLSTSFFHVIVQGINKEYIFDKNEYKDKYLLLLKESKIKNDIDIISYSIMSNHSHLLLHTEHTSELSSFMKNINEEFARYYNYKENRVGYVFKNRFLSEPITNQKYLLNCISYIHNNPVKANIVKDCKDYKYSSYNDYIKKCGFINDNIMEMIFGSKILNLKDFEILHSNKSYYFMEYNNTIEENIKEIIEEYEIRYLKRWEEIITERSNIEKIVVEIKERMKIPNKV